jgi:hypothetical protein
MLWLSLKKSTQHRRRPGGLASAVAPSEHTAGQDSQQGAVICSVTRSNQAGINFVQLNKISPHYQHHPLR